jgi:hypothetical protein
MDTRSHAEEKIGRLLFISRDARQQTRGKKKEGRRRRYMHISYSMIQCFQHVS